MSAPKSNTAEFVKGIWAENPTLVQVLGMCPSLAVTNTAINAVAMGVSTAIVLIGSSFLVSLLRKLIPDKVRITAFIIIIATFVTIADFCLEAMVPAVHRELGAFIPLIVVNCIILGRAEAFAARNPVPAALADAAGNGLGFILSLLALGTIREIVGNGSLFGISLFGPSYEPWVLMILPPGGFFTLGLLMLLTNWLKSMRQRAVEALAEPAAGELEQPGRVA